jgi:hypothetical protein
MEECRVRLSDDGRLDVEAPFVVTSSVKQDHWVPIAVQSYLVAFSLFQQDWLAV